MENLVKGKCDYLREHEICTMDIDAKECRWKDKEGWCQAVIIDTTPERDL